MKPSFGVLLGILAAGTAFTAAPVHAASRQPRAEATVGPMTPAQRGAMTRAYVLKWGPYVNEVYGVPVDVWARRMVSTFVHADPDNFRAALERNTYEGASAALSGAGHRLSDDQVIDSMARDRVDPRLMQADMGTQALGAAASDLVFTPITPCRILDTRVVGGPIAGGLDRDFKAVVGAGGNFSSQGGSATDCGAVAAGQAAVVINLTAVTPGAAGFATAYPFGANRPLASSVNYTAGAIVNNTVVVKLPSPLTLLDFRLYTFATSNFVADIVGFYSPPSATALECNTVNGASTSVAASAYIGLSTVNCPATYTPVSIAISASNNVVVADSYLTGQMGQVFVKNLSPNAQPVSAQLICCRVPGR